jgi:hypothetical protein
MNMPFGAFPRVVLPEAIAKGPHAEHVRTIVDELRAMVAKERNIGIENVGVEIALTESPGRPGAQGRTELIDMRTNHSRRPSRPRWQRVLIGPNDPAGSTSRA